MWESKAVICVKFQVSSKQTELGIGQVGFTDNRYKLVDFLPVMYLSQTVITSQKPKEITTYDMLIIPFDKYVWSFTLGCIITQFLLLVMMQNLWSNVTGTSNPNDYVFEGLAIQNLFGYWLKRTFTDFFLSTELIPKRRQMRWIQRPGFVIRKIVILKWIFLGNILTMAYKKSLLSSLIPIQYEDSIDSIDDLDNSGLPLMLGKGYTLHELMSSDSRPIMRRIFNRSILVTVGKNGIPKWAFEM